MMSVTTKLIISGVIYEPGMVVTVEPGIYISPDNTSVAEKWRGLAVRIEDDIAVTKTGCEDLTAGVPKRRSDIESLMARLTMVQTSEHRRGCRLRYCYRRRRHGGY